MTRDSFTLDAAPRHLEAGFPPEWFTVRVGDEAVIVNEAREGSISTYTIAGTTTNARVLATADAVLWEGDVLQTHWNGTSVVLQHTFAGISERLPVVEFLDDPVPTLEQTEMIDLEALK
jgi:hypothetical protein